VSVDLPRLEWWAQEGREDRSALGNAATVDGLFDFSKLSRLVYGLSGRSDENRVV
jgi:hypothetical protein